MTESDSRAAPIEGSRRTVGSLGNIPREVRSSRVRSAWLGLACWLISAAWTLGSQAGTNEVPPLPQKLGFVNDYANALSGPQEQELESRLEDLYQAYGVEIVVLTAFVDPFEDISAYASAIAQAWKLDERHVLLLFERTGDQWDAMELRLSPSAAALVRDRGGIEPLRARLKRLVQRQSIRAAMEDGVSALEAWLAGETVPSEQRGFHFSLPQLDWRAFLSLGLLGVVGVLFGVRTVLRRFCPRCGRRLRSYRGPTRGYSRYRMQVSCPKCGYGRILG